MSHWGNSRELTRASYDLVKANPGMNRWIVRAIVHASVVGGIGVLLAVALAGGGLLAGDKGGSAGSSVGVVALVLGLVVLVLAFLAAMTAANLQLAGLVSATDDVLHGREPDEAAAKAAARSRLGALAAWSAISMAVGALVNAIRGDGNGGIATQVIRMMVAGLVAAVWAVVTTLVMPIIVLEGAGAVHAVKRSASIIRSTWGEAVLGSVRIGARFALTFILPGFLLLAGGIALAVAVGGPAIAAGAVLAVAGFVLILIGSVKAATCRNVFGVALYRWSTGEGALGPFSEEDLRGAVQVRGGSVPVGV
jgi:hypothetical protein